VRAFSGGSKNGPVPSGSPAGPAQVQPGWLKWCTENRGGKASHCGSWLPRRASSGRCRRRVRGSRFVTHSHSCDARRRSSRERWRAVPSPLRAAPWWAYGRAGHAALAADRISRLQQVDVTVRGRWGRTAGRTARTAGAGRGGNTAMIAVIAGGRGVKLRPEQPAPSQGQLFGW